jgi:hypothetical protein
VADFVQLPGTLNFRVVSGDEVNAAVNLTRDISGYTFTTAIYSTNVTGGGGGDGSLVSIGQTITVPALGIVAATAGTMIVGLTETQTATLVPGQTYRWYLRGVAPGDVTRTILSGDVVTVAP